MKQNNERENNRRNQWNKNYLKNINITDNSITILTKGGIANLRNISGTITTTVPTNITDSKKFIIQECHENFIPINSTSCVKWINSLKDILNWT